MCTMKPLCVCLVFVSLLLLVSHAEAASSQPAAKPVTSTKSVTKRHAPKKSVAKSSKKKAVVPPITRKRYLLGGIVGSLAGFGIGHAITGHYHEFGWVFTLSQVLSLSIPLLTAGIIVLATLDGKLEATGDALISGWSISLIAGLTLYAAFRLWEIIDIWRRPKVLPAGVTSAPTKPKVAIAPFFTAKGGMGMAIGGTF